MFFADSDHYLDLDFARSMDDIKAISVQLNGQPEIDLNGGNKGFYSDHSMNHSVRIISSLCTSKAKVELPAF